MHEHALKTLNTKRFSDSCWRRCFTPTKEKTKAGHWMGIQGLSAGKSEGPQTPETTAGAATQRAASAHAAGVGVGKGCQQRRKLSLCTGICTKWKERPLQPEVWEWTVIRHQTEEKLGRPSFQAKQKIVQNGKRALHG